MKYKGGARLKPSLRKLGNGVVLKDKVRPGESLCATTVGTGHPGTQVGKSASFDFQSYVAVELTVVMQALQRLNNGKIKGRSLRVRVL